MVGLSSTGRGTRPSEDEPTLRVRLTAPQSFGWPGESRPYMRFNRGGIIGFQPLLQNWDASWRRPEVPQRPTFAQSPAYHTLLRELRNYLNGEIRGRSFLISGHRGAGKTSMVLRAVEDLYDEAIGAGIDPFSFDLLRQRPLLIRLHGPSLLAAMTAAKQKAKTDDAAAAKAGEPAADDSEATRDAALAQVLSQIMICIYRALTAEVVQCYRQHIRHRANFASYVGDPVETIGQLSLELDNAPSPQLLREYWRRAGALTSGLLWTQWRDRHQGMRELVAMATAAQAYRVISGAVTYSEGDKGEASEQSETESASVLAGKDIADKALGFLTGGLVGGAYWSQNQDQIVATAAIGLATAFISSWTFKFTTKRSKKQTATQEYTFIRKSDVSTLDRELPVVIERIREAGLAPVFVVDELDKVESLADAMADLIKRLKHIVADRSFFCFLTDRDYFELLQQKSRRLPYPQEHTYYSHRLFILYRPENLHTYLESILVPSREGTTRGSDMAPIFVKLLSYLVMHRAMLHVFDLQRELAKICDDAGRVTVRRSELFSHYGYRYHIMVQLAVELLLSEDEMRDRLNQDPHFGQLAYDALYYMTRRWAAGRDKVDLSPDAIDRYLAGRIDPEWSEAQRKPVGAKDKRKAREVIAETINDTDHDFLTSSIRRMAGLLSDPAMLKRELASSKILEDVERAALELIPGADHPLLARQNDDLMWQHDFFGRPLISEEEESRRTKEPQAFRDVLAVMELLKKLSEDLKKATNDEVDFQALSYFGFISQSPDWSEVELAAARLHEAIEESASFDTRELVADENLVREFEQMLIERGPVVAMALALSAEFARLAELGRPANGFQAISHGLKIGEKEAREVGRRLRALLLKVWPDHEIPERFQDLPELAEALSRVSQWLQLRDITSGTLAENVEEFWADWSIDSVEAGEPTLTEAETIPELVLLSMGHGFLVREGLTERTVRGLTSLLASPPVTATVSGDKIVPLIPVPEWAFFWALGKLGFAHVLRGPFADTFLPRNLLELFPNWTAEGIRNGLRFAASSIVDLTSEPTEVVLVASGRLFGAVSTPEPGMAALQATAWDYEDFLSTTIRSLLGKTPFSLALIDYDLIDDKKATDRIRKLLVDSDALVAMSDRRYEQKAGKEKPAIPVIPMPDSLGSAVSLARAALQRASGEESTAKSRRPSRPSKVQGEKKSPSEKKRG